ncbi:MAG: BppU family phage baseplate upper protein [Nitrososphaerales archaeon]
MVSQSITLRLTETHRPEKRIFLALDAAGDELVIALKDKNGNAVDLTGKVVRFRVWNRGLKPFLDADCAITDAVNGQCQYVRQKTDLEKAGVFYCKVIVRAGTKEDVSERVLLVVQE